MKMPGMPQTTSSSSDDDKFNLTSDNQGFQDRRKDIFSLLDTIEKKHEADESAKKTSERTSPSSGQSQHREQRISDDVESHGSDRREEHRRSRSPQDVFKVPPCRPRIPHRRGGKGFTADYRRYPERWTRYDLSDVSADQMSDKSNTSAAFAFLDERRRIRREENEKASMDVTESEKEQSRKVIFNKPSCKMETKEEVPSTNTSQHSNVHVMEEYVVGQSIQPKKSKTVSKSVKSDIASCSKIDLGHLESSVPDDNETVSEIKDVTLLPLSDLGKEGDSKAIESKDTTVEVTESDSKESVNVEIKPQGFKTTKHKKRGIRNRTQDDTD